MSSSLTDPLIKDPSFTFQQFAWLCTRSLMMTILLRDSEFRVPTEEDITDAVCASEVEQNEASLRAAQEELAVHERMTAEQWQVENDAFRQRLITEHAASLARHTERRERFVKMLEQVYAWQPPTPEHESLKRVMTEQCQHELDERSPVPPVLANVEQYREQSLDYARKRVEWKTKDLQRSRERVAHREAWFKALRESIPLP